MCVKKHTERGRQDRINNKRNERKKELGHWKYAPFPEISNRFSQERKGGWDTVDIRNLLFNRLFKCTSIQTHAWGSSHSLCIRRGSECICNRSWFLASAGEATLSLEREGLSGPV